MFVLRTESTESFAHKPTSLAIFSCRPFQQKGLLFFLKVLIITKSPILNILSALYDQKIEEGSHNPTSRSTWSKLQDKISHMVMAILHSSYREKWYILTLNNHRGHWSYNFLNLEKEKERRWSKRFIAFHISLYGFSTGLKPAKTISLTLSNLPSSKT